MPLTLPGIDGDPRPSVVTIGSYDGVHSGHRALLRRVASEAGRRGARQVVVTFDPHPRCVVDPAGCPPLLSSPAERAELLHAAGVDHVATLRFDAELSRWSAQRFCTALTNTFDVRALVVGPGFALGRRRQGDVSFLRAFAKRHGFALVTVVPLQRGGRPVSSSRIREAIAGGAVGDARAMLGRAYPLDGEIVRGAMIGVRLGFPTANLAPDPGRVLPGTGIYATWLRLDDEWLPAATSVGYRPTYGAGGLTVEAHVLDFAGDLYGRRVRLAFVRRLRGERRFASERALAAAIAGDVRRVRTLLAATGPPQ